MSMNKLFVNIFFVMLISGCATGGFQADVVARDAAGDSSDDGMAMRKRIKMMWR